MTNHRDGRDDRDDCFDPMTNDNLFVPSEILKQ